jgi:hypothetical protein
VDGPDGVETYNPWTIVNLVFHHLVDNGLHPVFGATGDPGEHAAGMLRALGIRPAAEGNSKLLQDKEEELARLRVALLGEA